MQLQFMIFTNIIMKTDKINYHLNMAKMQKQNSPQGLDMLRLNQQCKLRQFLQKDEKIILSCMIQKFNEVNKSQERIFLLTNRAIYNIKKNNIIKSFMSKLVRLSGNFSIKRQIDLKTIYGITLSKENSTQFIINIHQQYDYRYRSPKKMTILKEVCSTYVQYMNKKMAFYFVDALSLIDYCTTKINFNMRICKKPKKQPNYFGVAELIAYQLPKTKYQLVYSVDGGQFPIQKFNQLKDDELNQKYKYFTIKTVQQTFDKLLKYFEHKNNHFISLPSYCYLTKGKTHLIRPLMKGGSLLNLLKSKGPFNQQLTRFYISQLIIVLEYFHSRGFLYRCLSLDYVYLKDNGYICVDGLNECELKKSVNRKQYGLIGHPSHMAPQMILCYGYGVEADIWSLGVCLAEMLLGYNIFQGGNNKSIFANILYLKNIPESLPNVVHKILVKNPSDRISLPEIKKDIWFSNVKWDAIQSETLKAVYIPQLQTFKEWYGQCPQILYLQ